MVAVETVHDQLAYAEVEDRALEGHAAVPNSSLGCRGCRYLSLLLALYAFPHLPPNSSFFLKQFEKKCLHPLHNISFSASIRQKNQTKPSTQVSTNPLLARCNPLPVNVEGCGAASRHFRRHLPTTNAPLEVLIRRPGRSGGRWLQSSQSRVEPNHRQRVLRIVGGGRCRGTNPYIRCRAHWPGP